MSLSDKRHEVWEDEDDTDEEGTFCYHEESVKKAVKELKELPMEEMEAHEIRKAINKIFGEKLTQTTGGKE